jgi:hypothetical protein
VLGLHPLALGLLEDALNGLSAKQFFQHGKNRSGINKDAFAREVKQEDTQGTEDFALFSP